MSILHEPVRDYLLPNSPVIEQCVSMLEDARAQIRKTGGLTPIAALFLEMKNGGLACMPVMDVGQILQGAGGAEQVEQVLDNFLQASVWKIHGIEGKPVAVFSAFMTLTTESKVPELNAAHPEESALVLVGIVRSQSDIAASHCMIGEGGPEQNDFTFEPIEDDDPDMSLVELSTPRYLH